MDMYATLSASFSNPQQQQVFGQFPNNIASVDPLENQQCRVCEEPAAGFHFGAFTCEGCKSFFGRTCNNQSVIQECKNNYRCVVDKKNRTACKACRLRKCLMVGMSKSGSRYGRRSNWFKIHCLMQQRAPKTPQPQMPPILPASSMPSHYAPYSRPLIPLCSPKKPFLSSRSPSPLNTSTDTSSIQSSPSPLPDSPISFMKKPEPAVSPPRSLISPPAISPPLSLHSPPTIPLSSPSDFMNPLYRLSPLLALNPLLIASNPLLSQMLMEHHKLLESFRAEAACSSPRSSSPINITSDAPMDLSVK